MANNCSNTIKFYGSEANLALLRPVLQRAIDSETSTTQSCLQYGDKPDEYTTFVNGHFDGQEHKNELVFNFITKWNGRPEEFLPIYKKYECTALHFFEELGSDTFSYAFYSYQHDTFKVLDVPEDIELSELGDYVVLNLDGSEHECREDAYQAAFDLVHKDELKSWEQEIELFISRGGKRYFCSIFKFIYTDADNYKSRFEIASLNYEQEAIEYMNEEAGENSFDFSMETIERNLPRLKGLQAKVWKEHHLNHDDNPELFKGTEPDGSEIYFDAKRDHTSIDIESVGGEAYKDSDYITLIF